MDYALMIGILANTLAMIGTCIFFYFHSDGKINAIEKEIKDFHGRLCKLEEKYFQWLMRDK